MYMLESSQPPLNYKSVISNLDNVEVRWKCGVVNNIVLSYFMLCLNCEKKKWKLKWTCTK